MNTKIYKKVHSLASDLMKAADREDEKSFYGFYDQLQTLCEENEQDKVKNHPVQWEALADFTDDLGKALGLYEKALALATDTNALDYLASINLSMARLLLETNQTEQATEHAKNAQVQAKNLGDNELCRDIDNFLEALN